MNHFRSETDECFTSYISYCNLYLTNEVYLVHAFAVQRDVPDIIIIIYLLIIAQVPTN